MAKFKIIKRGLKTVAIRGGIIGTGALVGGSVSYDNAIPGLKHSAAKEGAVQGALLGTAVALSPEIGKLAIKAGARTSKRLARKGKYVFRRIRGRLVPIKVK